MPTIPPPATPLIAVPVALTLTIDRTRYRVTRDRLAGQPTGVLALWTLRKPDGGTYQLRRTKWGLACSCPDWKYRRVGTDEPCKHIAAAVSVGLA